MKESTLDTAIAEAQRFLGKCEALKRATRDTDDESFLMCLSSSGFDAGFNTAKYRGKSKTRAAVMRSCIDLRNALSDVTQGR